MPATTGLGALARHLTESDPASFQPANVNWGLFLPLPGRVSRDERKRAYAARAAEELAGWAAREGVPLEATVPGELPAPTLAAAAVG